jgi:glycosyltransferase involved in cell wall biosynthesis
MRILLITQHFPPESGASQNRLGDLSRRLAGFSHHVTVVTALPNYPRGEFYEGYRGRLLMEEDWNGVRVIRTWVYPTKSKKVMLRLLNYFSFLPFSMAVGLFMARKGDVVLVDSPPLFLGLTGLLVTRLRRARLILNVADLWPASVVTLGVVSNRFLIRWATSFEEYLYRHCALITGQTPGIVRDIRGRCPGIPVNLMTNGVAPEFLKEAEKGRLARDRVREEFGWNDKFVVGYAGLHGLAQDLDLVLRTSQLLSDSPEVVFALFGDGPEKPRLQKAAADLGLHNVQFHAQVPTSRVPEILTAMDAALIPLKRKDLFKGGLPSKLFEAMGAAVPVIVALEGEAQDIVERSQGGICIEPENALQFVHAIRKMKGDPAVLEAMGKSGRDYVMRNFNRQDIAREFERLIEGLNSSPLSPGVAAPPTA